MSDTKRHAAEYSTVVGYLADGSAVILNETFSYSDDFHGATGAIVELISQERYDAETTDEALEERGEEIWRQDAGSINGTTSSLKAWAQDARDDLIESTFDGSYGEALPSDGWWVTTNCVAGGRIFPHALDDLVEIVRPDLVEVIRDAEEGNA